MIDTDNDAVGHAFYDYYKQGKASTLWCNIKGVGDDIVPIEYFFRSLSSSKRSKRKYPAHRNRRVKKQNSKCVNE